MTLRTEAKAAKARGGSAPSSKSSTAGWRSSNGLATTTVMEVASIPPKERTRLNAQFKSRGMEFQAASYIFDSAHLLCEELADLTLVLIEERAMRRKSTEWYVSGLHAVLVAKLRAGGGGACSFVLGGKRVERQQVCTALSVSALLEVEARTNGDG